MSFLHPAILVLLPLAAIPIILHLITLHRLKTTELSTFRFLFESYIRQQSRLKFMELLLTILRTLVILLVVLVVCRPVMKRWSMLFRPGSGREKVVLVDCSASMNARTAGVSALERAKAAALSVAQRLAKDERLTLVRVTAQPEEVFSRFGSDTEAVHAKIESLEFGPGRANIVAALQHVFQSRGTREVPPVVYVITDCQASSWLQADQGLDQMVPEGARIFVVDVGTRKTLPNHAVYAEPLRQRAIVGLPVIFKPRVANYAPDEAADITVKTFLNEREVARTTVTVKPGEKRTAEMTYVPRESGAFRGRFEIAPDRFPDDDAFLFTLTVTPPVQVTLVNGNPNADPFENEALYLRTALTTTMADGDAPVKPAGDAAMYNDFIRSLDVREIPEAGLTPDILRTSSVTILANCGQLNTTHFGWLRDYVTAGGGLILFPGDLVKPEIYNDQFFPVPGPQKERLTALRLDKPLGDPAKAVTFERFTAIDFHHPILGVFDAPQAKYLTSVRFYRWFPLGVTEGQGNAWSLVRFSTGAPALVESGLGEGRVLTAAFPINTKWSNLPLKPEFVPLMLRMVNYVQRRPEVEVPGSVLADGVCEVAVTRNWSSVTGTVTDVKGRTVPLTFKRADGRMVAPFDRPRAKGYYTVDVKGTETAQPKTGTAVLAVDVATEESNFSVIDQDQLRKWMPRAKVTLVDASAEAQQLSGTLGEEREIWRPMIWFLFVIIGVEFAIATLSGQKRAKDVGRLVMRHVGQVIPGRWKSPLTRLTGLPFTERAPAPIPASERMAGEKVQ